MTDANESADFFRQSLVQMIDLRHSRAVLAARLPWAQIESALAPCFARQNRQGCTIAGENPVWPILASGRHRCCRSRPLAPDACWPRRLRCSRQCRMAAKLGDSGWLEVGGYFAGEDSVPLLPMPLGNVRSFEHGP